jgi:hypothetical protein
MTLKLRPAGLSRPVDHDQKDYVVMSGDFVVGRIYEDRHVRKELRWFWAINGVRAGSSVMQKDGRTPTIEEAKAHLADNWRRWLAWAKLHEID